MVGVLSRIGAEDARDRRIRLMGFRLFVLVNAALFIRPGEIVPDLEGLAIYLYLTDACIVVAYVRVFDQLTWESLRRQPITFCVVGVWLAAVASHLDRLNLFEARSVGVEFGKVVLYYLLLVGLVDSPARLRRLL